MRSLSLVIGNVAAEYRNGKVVVAAADVAASFVCLHSWQQAGRQAGQGQGGGSRHCPELTH